MTQHLPEAITVSVSKRKGGVGATTIIHALAVGLALHGWRVLVVEADDSPRLRAILSGLTIEGQPELDARFTPFGLLTEPEAGVSRTFSVNLDLLWQTMAHVNVNKVHEVRSARSWAQPGVFDYVPGSENIKGIEKAFARLERPGFEPNLQLAKALVTVRHKYDFILIDTPPTMGVVPCNAIAASDYAILLVDFDFASIEDYRRSAKFVDGLTTSLRNQGRHAPARPFVVYNKFNADNPDHLDVWQVYTEDHEEEINGQRVIRPAAVRLPSLGRIPNDETVARREERYLINRAAKDHRSLHQYAPLSEVGGAMYEMVCNLERAVGVL